MPFLVPTDTVPPDLVLAHNMSRVDWACVRDENPLTFQVQYSRADGVVRRIEAFRPWRTSTWRPVDGTPTVTDVACALPSGRSSSPYEIAVLSVPRSVDYFSDTMRQVRRLFPAVPAHVVTNTPLRAYTRWASEPNVSVHVLSAARALPLKARSILMYEYALSVSPSTDVLVLEDDVTLHPRASARLGAS